MFLTKEVWELRLRGGRVDESLVKREHVGEFTALLVDLFGEHVEKLRGAGFSSDIFQEHRKQPRFPNYSRETL